MAEPEEEKLRRAWPDEAKCFTPLLAERIHLLGDTLGMELKCVQQEAPVDNFRLDILARDCQTCNLVAIENQLEWSDHDHLGKLLTYATDYEARTAIWVAYRFETAHLAAIDCLNHRMPGDMGLWCVEVRAIKDSDSRDIPKFRVVLSPNDRERGEQGGDDLIREEKTRRFLKSLRNRLLEKGFARVVEWEDEDPNYFIYFPSGFEGIRYAAGLNRKDSPHTVGAFIWVSAGSVEEKQRIFGKLESETVKRQLTNQISDACWYWSRRGNAKQDSLGIRTPGSIDDLPEVLEQHKVWLAEHLWKLKQALDPHLREIPGVKPTEASP